MLSPDLIDEVRRLLCDGHSRRLVARRTGISRNTINRIADGRRVDHEDSVESEFSSIPRTKPKRCRTCGGMVYPPCKLCRLRAM
jgi:hypothetical protein